MKLFDLFSRDTSLVISIQLYDLRFMSRIKVYDLKVSSTEDFIKIFYTANFKNAP